MSEPDPVPHTEPSWRCKCHDCERRRWLAYDRTQQEDDNDNDMDPSDGED